MTEIQRQFILENYILEPAPDDAPYLLRGIELTLIDKHTQVRVKVWVDFRSNDAIMIEGVP